MFKVWGGGAFQERKSHAGVYGKTVQERVRRSEKAALIGSRRRRGEKKGPGLPAGKRGWGRVKGSTNWVRRQATYL